jgi:hypothetical protein
VISPTHRGPLFRQGDALRAPLASLRQLPDPGQIDGAGYSSTTEGSRRWRLVGQGLSYCCKGHLHSDSVS